MQALRLTWELASPIVASANPFHLDAIVMFAVAQETAFASGGVVDETLQLDIPIEQAIQGNLSCWKASALLAVEPGEHAMRFWTRKSDAYDYAQRMEAGHLKSRAKFPLVKESYSQKFDTVRGGFKQMFKHYPVREVKAIQAWCIGDMDRLTELLAPDAGYITYLGAKARMGHGRVKSFAIDVDENAHEFWKRRILPWEQPGYVQIEAAVRPPYWDLKNRQLAWVDPAIYS